MYFQTSPMMNRMMCPPSAALRCVPSISGAVQATTGACTIAYRSFQQQQHSTAASSSANLGGHRHHASNFPSSRSNRGGFQQKPRHQSYGNHNTNNEQLPIKDRSPPKAYDPQNPKRRLAVLVDASKVNADVFCRSIEPLLPEIGVPVLIRIFDYELQPLWKPVTAGHLSSATQEAATQRGGSSQNQVVTRGASSSNSPTIEWFRVERFIPISMQIAADAQHIFDFKEFNRVEGVCFVCSELDRPYYESTLLQRLKGKGFNQYLCDEMGLAVEITEDGRSRDGAASNQQRSK
mmetsp:Transcript_72696/g.84431  ORF Transcript_72696/g.84431 Transcript_72696/m.84431 type:complete len:292 (+) Transcript_72696:32-907(+)